MNAAGPTSTMTKAAQALAAEYEPAKNVVEALSRVMDELPGIGKNQRASEQQGGYAYRGIEAITREAQPLLAKHGVVFVPRVINYEVVDIVVGGRPWTDTRLLVEYGVFGPGGAEDCITVGPIFAIGRDNSDKGANKCMTQAFKYALLQVFCVADAKDDGDSASHEAQFVPAEPPPLPAGWESRAQQEAVWDELRAATAALTDDFRAEVQAELKGKFTKATFTPEHAEHWRMLLPAVEQ